MKNYTGIDCGKDGGIVTIDSDGNIVSAHVTPTMDGTIPVKSKKKTKEVKYKQVVDMVAFREILAGETGLIMVEALGAIFGIGKTSYGSMMNTYGLTVGLIAGLDKPYREVKAKVWQDAMFKGVDKVMSGKKHDTKATASVIAQLDGVSRRLHKTARSTVPHDGMVDAYLIAQYCRSIG